MPTTLLTTGDPNSGTNEISDRVPGLVDEDPGNLDVQFDNSRSRRGIVTFDLENIVGLPATFTVSSAILELDVSITPGQDRYIIFELIDREDVENEGTSWLRYRAGSPGEWNVPGGDVFIAGMLGELGLRIEQRGPINTGAYQVDITTMVRYAVLREGWRRFSVRVSLFEVETPIPDGGYLGVDGPAGVGKTFRFYGKSLIGTGSAPSLDITWSETTLATVTTTFLPEVDLLPPAVVLTLVLPVLDLTVTPFGPGIGSGVPVPRLDASLTLLAPSVTTGGVTVTTGIVTASVEVLDPIAVLDILLPLQSLTVDVPAASILAGGVTAQADLLNLSVVNLSSSVDTATVVGLSLLDISVSLLPTSIQQESPGIIKVNFV